MIPGALTETQIAERLADLARQRSDLDLLVLFGSAAGSRTRAGSDIDLAIRCDGPADLDALYASIAERLHADPIDLVDLRGAGPLLAFEVARSGRLIFERHPGVFRQFQSLASRRYCDTAKLRRAQRRAIHAFLEREGLE
jgi:predicted nucleotidyltransferase